MQEKEYKFELQQAWTFCHLIADMPIQEMLEAISHTDALGPILDPTAWIKGSKAMHEDEKMLKALLGVQKALKEMAKA